MNTLDAFARGEVNRGKEEMVFDWDEAARRIAATKPKVASAGLAQDWDWTGGDIYRDGKPVNADDTYVFLASTWATPELDMDGVVQSCFKMESETPGWTSSTYWPESALAILAAVR